MGSGARHLTVIGWFSHRQVSAIFFSKRWRNVGFHICTHNGKLMGRVITRRLTWFLKTNNIFSPSHTGYRQNRSTEDQLALPLKILKIPSKRSKSCWQSFLACQKHSTVCGWKGLQWKLLRALVSGQMYRWISSFPYHRMARVKLDGSLSREIRLSEGLIDWLLY